MSIKDRCVIERILKLPGFEFGQCDFWIRGVKVVSAGGQAAREEPLTGDLHIHRLSTEQDFKTFESIEVQEADFIAYRDQYTIPPTHAHRLTDVDFRFARGLIVEIMRPAAGYDCTNGGLSSAFSQAILIGDDVAEIFDFSDNPAAPENPNAPFNLEMPALKLIHRSLGDGSVYHFAEPVAPGRDGSTQWMAGGHFIFSSDGRFHELNGYPLPIHDRQIERSQ